MSRLDGFGLTLEGEESIDSIVAELGLSDQAFNAMKTDEAEFMRKPSGYMDQGYRYD